MKEISSKLKQDLSNSSNVNIGLQVSQEEIIAALNGLVRDFLPPATFILSLLYISFAIGHIFVLPAPINNWLFTLAAITAVIFVVITTYTRKKALPLNLVNPLCFFIAAIMSVNSTVHIYLVQEAQQTTNFMLLVIGIGSIFLSVRWFTGTLIFVLASWAGVAYFSTPSPYWVHFGFALFASAFLSIVMFRTRLINFTHLETLHIQDRHRQKLLVIKQGELEQVLNSLTASEAYTRSIINNMLVGLITLSSQGCIDSLNPAAEKMFGYQAKELIGQHIQALFSKRSIGSSFEDFLKNHLGRITEINAIKKDGSIFLAEFSLSVFRVDHNTYYSGHLRDISEQKEAERTKTEFVATVSHELRTPLASISGSLSLLSAGFLGDLSTESQEAVEIAERNSKRLLNLINDILDYERLEKGTLEMQFEEVSILSIVSRAVETIKVVAEKEEIKIEAHISDNLIYADEDRLAQVLVNLLSNAIKFSLPKGKIIISSQQVNNKLEVKVIDFGRGIPVNFHGQIFERFKQVEANDSRKKGGTGLGLAICKAIIEKHNGQIGVESQEGKGSTFWFSLPLK